MTSQVSIPAAVLGLQGMLNAAFGIYGIVRPADWRAQVTEKFGGGIPSPVGHTLSLQLLNMGIFTVFAATRPSLHRRALIARFCVHLMAGYLFWDEAAKTKPLAYTDLGFAVMNAVTIPFA